MQHLKSQAFPMLLSTKHNLISYIIIQVNDIVCLIGNKNPLDGLIGPIIHH